MAEIKNVFDISGRAMAAQLIRLNTVASNLANKSILIRQRTDEKIYYTISKKAEN